MGADVANDTVVVDRGCIQEVTGHIPADPRRDAADQLEIVFEVAPARNDGCVVPVEVKESGLWLGVEIVPATVPESLSGLVEPAEVH